MAQRGMKGAAAALAMTLLVAGGGVRAQEDADPSNAVVTSEDGQTSISVTPASTPAAPLTQGLAPRAPAPGLPSPAEIARLREGVIAADARNWDAVRAARAVSGDPLVKRVLQWRLASDMDAPASFLELRTALDELQGWPGRTTMRRRAEQAIFDSGWSPAQRIAWLQAEGPVSGDGKVALAQALKAAGRREEAAAVIRDAWRTNTITPRAEALAFSDLADLLRTADHAARVDWALWRDDRAVANRLVARLGAEDAAVARARLALQTRPRKGLQAAVDRVPEGRRSDAGFLYDRTRYYRVTGRPELAFPVAARIDVTAAPEVAREPLFKERRRYVPRALREGQRTQAYNLVNNHGVATGGEAFAEAEWLAGWLALRFTRNAADAERHFVVMDGGVSTPISKARAAYWRAMAAKTQGRDAEAAALLKEAARYNFTYYGLIAAAKVDPAATLSFGDRLAISPQERAAFDAREVVRALRLIALVGDERDFESIAYFLDDQLTTPAEHEMLAQIAREQAFTRIAVRSAKAGIRRGILAPDAAYPLLDIPAAARKPGRPEPALILAITRQESEFDPRAVSSAGARGLMQIMPATARAVAQREGLPYQPGWLIDDPAYNMTLGAAYLESLLADWNGSYVLTIASYNAGPGRSREWIGDWGDPRQRNVDVIDWVELIPFSETRNYVQRVLENVQVYRHRLAGAPVPVRIEQDLKRGGT
ncbi:MAG: lytic transglycosylase domain-containing protein [Hyphomonadaceae bacterium]|nr:lytic transglycosylase domain-containing protein [Hyphomonadaceae bacterium]